MRQFNHLIRTVPGRGRILARTPDTAIDTLLARGCWTPVERFGIDAGDWQAALLSADGSRFEVARGDEPALRVAWQSTGRHNVENALAAMAAAAGAGVSLAQSARALGRFRGVKRRLEHLGEVNGVHVYDDFAHHPTAILTTLAGLRARVGDERIHAVLEPRSNTMRMGVHRDELAAALQAADRIWLYQPAGLNWDLQAVVAPLGERCSVQADTEALLSGLTAQLQAGDHVLIMSNGGFEGLHQRLIRRLQEPHN